MAQVSTQPATQPKILRIGVIQAGRIIEEKLIRRRENVTIGSSTRNSFTIFAAGLPHSFTLFELIGGRYVLNFTDDMDGRLAVGDRVVPLQQVREEGLARQRGAVWQVRLSEASRGKVLIGDVTMLFQFVTPPPPRPLPMLPPSVRGGMLQQMDWSFAACLVGAVLAELGMVVWLRSVDPPREVSVEEQVIRFAQVLAPQAPPPPPEKKEEAGAGEEKKAEGEDKPKKSAKKGGDKPKADPEAAARAAEERARAAARKRAELAERVQRLGALKVLGAKGGAGSGGVVSDLVARGDPGADMDKAFQGVGGVTASGGGGGGLLKGKAGGTGTLVEGGDVGGVGEIGTVGTGEKAAERRISVNVERTSADDIDGELDPAEVNSALGRVKGAMGDCYNRALKANPNLSGKVEFEVSISPTGSVTSVEVSENTLGDAAAVDCMARAIKTRLRLGSGPATIMAGPFVFQAGD